MYKLICNKYGREYKTLTGKNSVLPLFQIDINSCSKRIIRENKTCIVVLFPGDKYSEKYILPITCKKHID